ncbi:hypothetical protein GBA52_008062 [Prunus armeniaca]|nr:hypothetical protein GBA52_008062 [Prunus armeniaca]
MTASEGDRSRKLITSQSMPPRCQNMQTAPMIESGLVEHNQLFGLLENQAHNEYFSHYAANLVSHVEWPVSCAGPSSSNGWLEKVQAQLQKRKASTSTWVHQGPVIVEVSIDVGSFAQQLQLEPSTKNPFGPVPMTTTVGQVTNLNGMFTSLGLKKSAEVESLTYLNSPENEAKNSKGGSVSRGQKKTIKSYRGRARKLHESGANLILEANILEGGRLQPMANGMMDLEQRVNSIINFDTRNWDLNPIQHLIDDRAVEAIAKIKFASPRNKDRLVWAFEKNGCYSVKSGYHWLHSSSTSR